MGGAGAAGLGLLWARHFACVIATIGQTVARNHRPSRVEQLSTLWGTPERNRDDGSGMGVWDRQDLTRALRDEHEARQQFLFLKHGKDDPIIHFGAVSHASPITGRSFYEALLAYRPGYFAVWDEGGHGAPPDPRLGEQWWTQGWNPIFDDVARLRRDEAFPAFSASSLDRDWGGGEGDGRISWDDESGFAADVDVSGDTGWRGDIAGALNRFLRWDSTGIIDEIDRFEIPLRLLDGPGAPGVDGWPSTGDLPPSASATVSVTLRRVQRFQVRPGERLAWRLGAQGGEIVAEGGEIFIEGLTLTQGWETLSITR